MLISDSRALSIKVCIIVNLVANDLYQHRDARKVAGSLTSPDDVSGKSCTSFYQPKNTSMGKAIGTVISSSRTIH